MEQLDNFWGLIMAGIGWLIWCVRLEALVRSNMKENAVLQREVKELESRISSQRREDQAALNNKLNTIEQDVKELLQRTSR